MFGGRTLFLHLDVGEGLYLRTEDVVGLYDITVCFSLNLTFEAVSKKLKHKQQYTLK